MNIHDTIQKLIDQHDVVLFMKGTPSFPMCGFSAQVANILSSLEVPFKGVNVLDDDALREGIKTFSDWPTIPQLYIRGEFIGGCDIVSDLFSQGQLQTLLDGATS